MIARFNGDKQQHIRLQEIESELGMSTEQLAQIAIDNYMKQYL
jgi:hypothetical protein